MPSACVHSYCKNAVLPNFPSTCTRVLNTKKLEDQIIRFCAFIGSFQSICSLCLRDVTLMYGSKHHDLMCGRMPSMLRSTRTHIDLCISNAGPRRQTPCRISLFCSYSVAVKRKKRDADKTVCMAFLWFSRIR